ERGGEGAFAAMRQADRETPCVKELAFQTALVATLSIHRVANDRESRVREVRPDLMRAAGDRSDVKKCPSFRAGCPRRDPLEAGRGLAATRADDHPSPVARVAKERGLDNGGGASGSPQTRARYSLPNFCAWI